MVGALTPRAFFNQAAILSEGMIAAPLGKSRLKINAVGNSAIRAPSSSYKLEHAWCSGYTELHGKRCSVCEARVGDAIAVAIDDAAATLQ